jgi:hypothetical protein
MIVLVPGLEVDPALGIATGLPEPEHLRVVLDRSLKVEHA